MAPAGQLKQGAVCTPEDLHTTTGRNKVPGVDYRLRTCKHACKGNAYFAVSANQDCYCGDTIVNRKKDSSTCASSASSACYLKYCNAHVDLKAHFCAGNCHTEAHARACEKHWKDHGTKEERSQNPDQCKAGPLTVYRDPEFTMAMFVGCYQDDQQHDLEHKTEGSTHTIDSCALACKQYKFMALQTGHCFCDKSFSTPAARYPHTGDTECMVNGTMAGALTPTLPLP